MMDVLAAMTERLSLMGPDAVLIGIAVAGFNKLSELATYAIRKRGGNGIGDGMAMLKNVREIVVRTDNHGVPLIYGGHSAADELKVVSAQLQELIRVNTALLEAVQSQRLRKRRSGHDGNDQ
jgi:hypothetical protein